MPQNLINYGTNILPGWGCDRKMPLNGAQATQVLARFSLEANFLRTNFWARQGLDVGELQTVLLTTAYLVDNIYKMNVDTSNMDDTLFTGMQGLQEQVLRIDRGMATSQENIDHAVNCIRPFNQSLFDFCNLQNKKKRVIFNQWQTTTRECPTM